MVGTNGSERLSRPERGVLPCYRTHCAMDTRNWDAAAMRMTGWSGLKWHISGCSLKVQVSIHSRLGRLGKAWQGSQPHQASSSQSVHWEAEAGEDDWARCGLHQAEISWNPDDHGEKCGDVMWCVCSDGRGLQSQIECLQRCSMGILLSSSGPSSTSLFLIASVKRFFQYCSHGRKMPERCVYINASKIDWMLFLGSRKQSLSLLDRNRGYLWFWSSTRSSDILKMFNIVAPAVKFQDFKGCSVEVLAAPLFLVCIENLMWVWINT